MIETKQVIFWNNLHMNKIELKKELSSINQTFWSQTNFVKINLYILDYKIRARFLIISIWERTITLQNLLALIPLTFGLFQIIFSKQSISIFLEKTIPGFSIPYEIFFLETLEETRSLEDIQKIDLYNDFIFLETNFFENFKKNKFFLGTFKNRNKNPNKIGSIYSKTYQIAARDIYNNSYYNFDEFPFKLNSIYNLKNYNNLILQTELNQVKKVSSEYQTLKDKEPDFLKKSFHTKNNLFLGFQYLVNSNQKLPNIKNFSNEIKSYPYKKRYNFFEKFQFINTEIKNLLYTQSILPSNFKIQKKNDKILIQDFDFNDYCCENILKLFYDFDLVNSVFVTEPRIMSGYLYPDLNTKQVKSFVLQKFFHKNITLKNFVHKIKIDLPLSTKISSKYQFDFYNLQNPDLKLKYKPTLLEGIQYREILFQGPGLILDSETKDLVLKNKKEVKKWIKNFLYLDNPLSDRKQSFFGKNKNSLEQIEVVTDSTFQNNSIIKIDYIDSYLNLNKEKFYDPVSVISGIEKSRVPYLDEQQWRSIIEKIKKDIENTDENDIQISIPLIRVKYPTQKPILWPLTFLDYSNLELNKNLLLKKEKTIEIVFHYSPFSQNFFTSSSLTSKNFGSIYKKFFTTYSYKYFDLKNKYLRKQTFDFFNNFSKNFYESWEPITEKSWMILTQYYFGLFVLKILQDFYKNYGKELLSYLLDIVASLGFIDEGLKEELQLGENEKGFRIIQKIGRRFRDIAGIHSILPELSEIVWFLRNYGRDFKLGKIVPKGILLIGPPGTGKTLLVQAIAGEAEVPVLVQSGSSLNDLEQEGLGAQRLKNLFDEARQLSPCIIFIDEIDTLGQKRESVIRNPMGTDEIIESIYEFDFQNIDENTDEVNFFPQPKIEITAKNDDDEDEDEISIDFFEPRLKKSELKVLQQTVVNQETKHQRLNLLMQFLVELDGLQARKGVFVIGATNRPNVLDSALTRPGRFDKILKLELPAKEKRIEILKLYSKNLGTEFNISWDYFANRTVGFSAADLSAVMNESSIQAIIQESLHTIKTIEKGIDLLTSYSFEKPNVKIVKDPCWITRLAYYQSGKAIVHTLLKNHPQVVVLHLWPRAKNARHYRVAEILEKNFFKINSRKEMESRLIGLYAGKAAELLLLCGNFSQKLKFWQSDLGIEDLNSATSLACFMTDKWYFYSKKIAIRKYHQILNQRNQQEIKEFEIRELYKQFASNIEKEILHENKIHSFDSQKIYQQWSLRPWWQFELTKQLEILDSLYGNWYRLYLPDPDESERNQEWIPPDEYYHQNNCLNDLNIKSKKTIIHWNNLYKIERDYIYQGLVLFSFNQAFSILDENREILDFLSDFLIRHEIIRQNEVLILINNFIQINKENKKWKATKTIENYFAIKNQNSILAIIEFQFFELFDLVIKSIQTRSIKNYFYEIQIFSLLVEIYLIILWFFENKIQEINFQNKKFIIQQTWGQKSRRNKSRFINFQKIMKISN